MAQTLPDRRDERLALRPEPTVDGRMRQSKNLSYLVGTVVVANERNELVGLRLMQLAVLLVGGSTRTLRPAMRLPDTVSSGGASGAPP